MLMSVKEFSISKTKDGIKLQQTGRSLPNKAKYYMFTNG